MGIDTQKTTSRRRVSDKHRSSRGHRHTAGGGSAASLRGRGQHDPNRPRRLRRAGLRRGGQRHGSQRRPDQAGRDGRCLCGPSATQLRWPDRGGQRPADPGLGRYLGDGISGRPDRGAAGAAVPRLRRLSEGDGLPAAGRCRHPDDAGGVSLGPLPLRHPEGDQRLHGKAGDGGWADHPQDDPTGRGIRQEEPQGRAWD